MERVSYLLFLSFIFLNACKNIRVGQETSVPYTLAEKWPALPEGYRLGNPAGIGIDTNGTILVFRRAGRAWPLILPMPESVITAKTILFLDPHSGKIVNSWGADLFIMPHGLTVDPSNNIWVTDVGLHQVFKFSHEGKLLMTLGVAKIPGNDSLHFNRPTDVAITGDGSFYVSDGYRNSRVVKFSPSGHYLFEWGKKGTRPGQFDIPHGLTLDEKGDVYVADRENNRIQVFDARGRFIKEYKDKSFGNICSMTFDTKRNQLIAVDDASYFKLIHKGSDLIVIDPSTGTILSRCGRSGSYTGPTGWYHDLAVDKDGNIYVADILGNRLQKFIRIPE